MFADRLNEKFKAIFGFVPTGRQPQILHLRVFAEFVLDVERLLDPGYGDKEVGLGALPPKPTRYREILFAEVGKRLRTPIFERETLSRGSRFDGPAVIEEDYSNTVVGPNQAVRIDDYGNLFVVIGADTRGKGGE